MESKTAEINLYRIRAAMESLRDALKSTGGDIGRAPEFFMDGSIIDQITDALTSTPVDRFDYAVIVDVIDRHRAYVDLYFQVRHWEPLGNEMDWVVPWEDLDNMIDHERGILWHNMR